MHVTAVPYPLPNHPSPPPPTYQPYQPYHLPTPQNNAPTLAPIAPNTAPTFEANTPIEALKPPSQKPEQKAPYKTKPLDSNVLNNLAIALQLLIVSNILSRPSHDSDPEIAANLALSAIEGHEYILPSTYNPPTAYISEAPPNYIIESPSYSLEPNHRYAVKEPSLMPNSKYLGSATSFVDSNIYASYSPRTSPRMNAGLMSPYEALTVCSDPILPSPYTKRDFKSPYAMIADSKDLFSISDFY